MQSQSATDTADIPQGPIGLLLQAIVTGRCVMATWNRDKVVLAPHILYMKHGEPFLDAVTVARNNMLPRERKLGTFKVTGLGDIRPSARTFDVHPDFDAEAGKYAAGTLVAVSLPEAVAA